MEVLRSSSEFRSRTGYAPTMISYARTMRVIKIIRRFVGTIRRVGRRNIALHRSSHNHRGVYACVPSRRLPFTLASSAGAIAAVLALAGTAWTQEAPKPKFDEVFTQKTAVTLPTGSSALASFDISWVDGRPSQGTIWAIEAIKLSTSSIRTQRLSHLFKPVIATATPNTFVGARGKINDPGQPDNGTVCGPPDDWQLCSQQ